MDRFLHRGIIAFVDDSEERKRYKVRVIGQHDRTITPDRLPWAETAIQGGGKRRGDFVYYEVDDFVWVAFEESRDFPVIVGGIVSGRGGPDVPSELLSDYERTQRRWLRLDGAGNSLDMSPLADELYIQMRSGTAIVKVSQLDDSITITSERRVDVTAPRVVVRASGEADVEAGSLRAQVAVAAAVRCEGTVEVSAADKINIGKYQPIGVVTLPPKTTSQIHVDATSAISADSGGTLSAVSKGDMSLSTKAKLSIHADSDITITGKSSAAVTVDKNATLTVKGSVTVSVDGSCIIDTKGALTLHSDTSISMDAPTVNVIGDTAVTVMSPGNVSVSGVVGTEVGASSVITQVGMPLVGIVNIG